MSSGVRVPSEFAVHTFLDNFPVELPTDKDSRTKSVYKCIPELSSAASVSPEITRESISFVLELSILFIRSTELKKKLIATYTKLEQKGPTC